MAPSSSPPLLLLLLLLLARACDAAAETLFLTHGGLSSSAVDRETPARNALDGDVASGISTVHFAATEKRYPWMAVDLGDPAKVEVFGRKADAACHFHTRRDAGADCAAVVVQENLMRGGAIEAGGSLRTTTRNQNGRARTTYIQGWMLTQTRNCSA
jgi:hypothetical protein